MKNVLGCRERNARRDDALNGRVVCQVEEQDGLVHGPVLLKILQRLVILVGLRAPVKIRLCDGIVRWCIHRVAWLAMRQLRVFST